MRKILFFALLMLIVSIVRAEIHYVGTGGTFTTLAQVNAHTFIAGDQILFKRGETFYGSLTITNSGSAGNPIIYGAYGSGAKPIITGFTTVSSWTNLGSNIWESTSAVSSLSTCNMVSINGVNTEMGRTPNNGFLGGWTIDSHTTDSLSLTSSDLVGTNWIGAEVVNRITSFTINKRKITSQTNGTISWDDKTSYESQDNNGIFIQNDVRTLDQQNEWYYNPTSKKIRIYSTSQPTNVKVASIDNLITVDAAYININNLDLQGANNVAIYSASTTVRNLINITDNDISFVGYAAIRGIRMKNSNILRNNITYSNNFGITVPNISTTYKNIVRDNVISNISLSAGMQTNMWSAISVGRSTLVEYNRIANCGHNGISFYGDSITIKNNYINTTNLVLEDGGAIYTYTGSSQPLISVLRITGNIIENCIGNNDGNDGENWPASGIYLDSKTNDCEIDNNFVTNSKQNCIYLNGNTNINLHDNTAYDASTRILRINAWNVTDYTVNNNKLITKTVGQYCMFINSGANDIPTKYTGNNNYFASPLGNTNLVYVEQPNEGNYKTLAQWKTFSSQDANSLGSPITINDVDQIQFYYNDTKVNKTVNISQPAIDLEGNPYLGDVVIEPFESLVLLYKNAYYVSSTGNDSNDGLTPETAWQTIAYACTQVTEPNSVINILNGTHTINSSCTVARGVSLIGQSKTGTIINSTVTGATTPTFEAGSYPTTVEGDQEFAYFTLNGNMVGSWAINASYRNNVKIHDIIVNGFTRKGIVLSNGLGVQPSPYATGNEVYNCTITNSAEKLIGGNQFGNIQFGGQSGIKIYNNVVTATGRAAGYNGLPLKFDGNGFNIYTQIYNNTLIASPYVSGSWDFAIELWREQGGTVVHDNYVEGSIDLVRCYEKGDSAFSVRIYNNTIGRPTTQTQVEKGIYLEYDISDVIIEKNIIKNVAAGIYIPRVDNSYLRNVRISYNIFSQLGQTGTDYQTWGIYYPNFGSNTTGYNMEIYNNIFEAKQGLGKIIMYAISLPSSTGFTGFYAKNNICTGWERGAVAQYSTSSVVDIVQIQNNIFYNNFNNNDPNYQSGWLPTNYTYSGTIKLNPLLNSDYSQQSNSPARNAGLNVGLTTDYLGNRIRYAPDIGAIEWITIGNGLKSKSRKPLVNYQGKPLYIE